MVREAEEFAEEDKKVKERIDARNGLESFLYNLKNTLDDDEKGVADKVPAEGEMRRSDMNSTSVSFSLQLISNTARKKIAP